MGEGELVFEKWGHAALCVERPGSPVRGICYNYGTTDFTRPVGVVWDFVRGKGRFWVSRDSEENMIQRYMGYDRSLWRQVLPFTPEQAMLAAARLEHEALPENRYYIYHHYFDNCTTRVRDIIDAVTDGALRKDTAGKLGPTYRDYSRHGFAELTWALIGTDLLLARQADEQPNLWQAMFLPEVLREHVTERLGAKPELIYEHQGRTFSHDPGMGGRGYLFGMAIVLAAIVALARWRGRFERLALAIMVMPLFLITVVVWGLPMISKIEALRYNEVLLVFLPLDLALPFLRKERRQRYAQLRVGWLALVSLLCAIGVLTQPLWASIALVFAPFAVIAAPVFPTRKVAMPLTEKTEPAGRVRATGSKNKSKAKAGSKSGKNKKKPGR